jgi:5-methylthioadenosine/S-adenosylhomocysteine deaminase
LDLEARLFSPMRTLIEGALLLDPDEPGGTSGPVDILIEGGLIRRIGRAGDVGFDARLIDAHGALAMPGLVDAHVHSSGLFDRGSSDNLPLELFMLWEVPPIEATPPPLMLYRARVLIGALEMLKAGTTSVFDDPIYAPEATEEAIDTVMGAWVDAGIRATVGIYQPDRPPIEWLPYLRELLPADVRRRFERSPDGDHLLDVHARFVDRWHGAAAGRIRCAASCSAPQRVTDSYLLRLHAAAAEHGLPLVMHVYESRAQRVAADMLYGRSLVRRMRDLGVLDQRSVVVHAVWVDEEDVGDLATAGATVVHSPSGNLRCGSGVMPFRMLADAGVPIALCTDEATVEDTSSLWSAGRLAAELHTLAGSDYRTWPTAREILATMTEGGARALGLEGSVGILREGAYADLLLIDLSTTTFVPRTDVVRHLVHGEQGASIRLVMVGGEVVVRNGCVLTLDEKRVVSDAQDLIEEHRDRMGEVDQWARRLRPTYEEVYRRCAECDVGLVRRLAP